MDLQAKIYKERFFSERIDYGMTYSIDQTHFFSRSIYQVKNHLYRICFARAQKAPIEKHIQVLEEKLARLTQRVPTLRIDHIPAVVQELVVGIPPVWIRLMRQVARAVIVYIDAVEAAEAEEDEEA